ncbi:MAG: pantoate--beta-alanine ligase [Bacteroidales bacterium]|nr:pantoate--beta-alanine ligase [Bacteroidales bacterium]
MLVFEKKVDLREYLDGEKSKGKTIGFVPTMGALHAGHIALIQKSIAVCDVTIASIFVNPIQFNNPEDLEKYPRTFEADRAMLANAGCDAVFYPSVEEMYPANEKSESFDFGPLEQVMEGAFRPGHFNGVAVVVKKLFDLVQPDKAIFGKKDFQQLAVIRSLVKKMNSSIEIIGLDTVREKDGLAMSSRNKRLSPKERNLAADIYKSLQFIKHNKHTKSPQILEKEAGQLLVSDFKVEYIQVVDGTSLQSIAEWSETNYPVVCVAAHLGQVRLIDNLEL